MKTISIRRMAIALTATAAATVAFSACESVKEEPPMNEYTSGRAYRVPDPTPMTDAETADYNAIRTEYRNATK